MALPPFLKGAGDLELFKSCVSVYTPVVLRESFALSRLEERYFGGVNRLFTWLMSGGVVLLAGARELQRSACCRGGAGSAGEGLGQKIRADFRSQPCCAVVPRCPWLCHHPRGGQTPVPHHVQPAALALRAAPAQGPAEPLRRGGTASPNVNRGLLCSDAVSRRGMGPSSSTHSSGSRGWRTAKPGCFGNISLRRQLSLGKQNENIQRDHCC